MQHVDEMAELAATALRLLCAPSEMSCIAACLQLSWLDFDMSLDSNGDDEQGYTFKERPRFREDNPFAFESSCRPIVPLLSM